VDETVQVVTSLRLRHCFSPKPKPPPPCAYGRVFQQELLLRSTLSTAMLSMPSSAISFQAWGRGNRHPVCSPIFLTFHRAPAWIHRLDSDMSANVTVIRLITTCPPSPLHVFASLRIGLWDSIVDRTAHRNPGDYPRESTTHSPLRHRIDEACTHTHLSKTSPCAPLEEWPFHPGPSIRVELETQKDISTLSHFTSTSTAAEEDDGAQNDGDCSATG
jgi:hypothetical protein